MEKEILDNFGKRIRRIRLDNGYTQEHISAECGISLSYYSLIENSKKKISLEIALSILSALEVDIAEFFLPYSSQNPDLVYLMELLVDNSDEDYIRIFTEILEKTKSNQ